MIKIAIPQNQKTTKDHIIEAGWNPVFETNPSEPGNRGVLYPDGYPIIQIRSMDIPRLISAGEHDVAFVGSDCVEETSYGGIEILNKFPYGRSWGQDSPRLELVAHQDSTVTHVKDIQPGSIVLTERSHITQLFLEANGLKTVIEKSGIDFKDFRNQLREEGCVGISTIWGSAPVQLKGDDYYGVMVNESGLTAQQYGLRVIGLIREVPTLLIANRESLLDETKGDLIWEFKQSRKWGLQVQYGK